MVADQNRRIDLAKALVQLGRPFNYHDFSRHPLDEAFPDLGELGANGYRSHAERIKRVAREERLTLRQTALRFSVRRSPFVGSPVTVANEVERWFLEGAADGFNVGIGGPSDLDLFVSERRAGAAAARAISHGVRARNAARGNLGLAVPANRHAIAREAVKGNAAAEAPGTASRAAAL